MVLRLRRALPDLAAAAVIVVLALALFRRAILAGQVFAEHDTFDLFYPLMAYSGAALRAGHLPLWAPGLFAGFPLFAEGEAGALSPLNLPLFFLLSPEAMVVWQSVLYFVVAGLGAYALARVLGLRPAGALLAAGVYAMAGLPTIQLHHTAIANAAAWLPWVLACAELALRAENRRRHLFLLLETLAIAAQALACHLQTTLLTLLALALSVALSLWLRAGGKPLHERALLGLGTLGLAPALGLALAGVQLLPLYELGEASLRAGGVTYAFASEYSFAPLNLVALFFPFFFRAPDGTYWGPWAMWEGSVYVGLLPLALAVWGAVRVRHRAALVWTAIGLLSLWLAFGSYPALNLHYWLWQLPGFNHLRAPARFTNTFVLALGLLAGFGLDDLRRAPATVGRGYALCLAGIALLLPTGLAAAHFLLDKTSFGARVAGYYVNLRGAPLGLIPEHAQHRLALATDPLQIQVLIVCLLLLASALLLARHSRGVRWGALVLCLAGADLFFFADAYHHVEPVDVEARPAGAAAFLAANAGDGRVAVLPGALPGVNRLLVPGGRELGGYDPLQPADNYTYTLTADYNPGLLLDLASVRYIVAPAKPLEASVDFGGLRFFPRAPLAILAAGGGAERVAFNLAVPTTATSLRLVSRLHTAVAVPQGAPVAEVSVVSADGERLTVPLLAGVQTAETAYDRADVRPSVQHARPTVAYADAPTGQPENMYFAEVALPRSSTAVTVEVRQLRADCTLDVQALAVLGPDGRVTQVGRFDRVGLREVYRDAASVVYANDHALPYASVVPRAVAFPPGVAPSWLQESAFDPRQEVALAGPLPPSPAAGAGAPGTASVTEAAPGRAAVAVESAGGFLVLNEAYFPGWRAAVDGNEAPLLRANYLFMAVPVPPGRHVVTFAYEPTSFRLGLALSGAAVLALLAWGALAVMIGRRAPARSAVPVPSHA